MQTLYALFFQIQVFLYALLNDSALIITSTNFQNLFFTIRLSILLIYRLDTLLDQKLLN